MCHDVIIKHNAFLAELRQLQVKYAVDLTLLPGDERCVVKLCIVSDGVFTELAKCDSLDSNYVSV